MPLELEEGVLSQTIVPLSVGLADVAEALKLEETKGLTDLGEAVNFSRNLCVSIDEKKSFFGAKEVFAGAESFISAALCSFSIAERAA